MRILCLNTDAYAGLGGIAQYNRDLLDALLALPQRPSIVNVARRPPGSQAADWEQPAGLEEHVISSSPWLYSAHALRAARRLRPDLIVCGHLRLLPVALAIKRLSGAPLWLELYGVDAWTPQGSGNPRVPAAVDLVSAISRCTRARFLEWCDIDPAKVKLLPNAIRLERYGSGPAAQQLLERYQACGHKLLLTLGRLAISERYKGQDRVLALLPMLLEDDPSLLYMIAGEGQDRQRLESLAHALGVQHAVRFTGLVRESEKVALYRSCAAFAMPSTKEGFGFTFLEALACGLPVLAGSRDGSVDALLDGRLGLLVDPLDPRALLAGLRELLRRESGVVPAELEVFGFERFQSRVQQLVQALSGERLVGAQ